MKIDRVTITGADDNTDIKLLQEIQKKFPFVEWGILISTNQNRNRYPSEEFIFSLRNCELNLSLHVCGKHSRTIMKDGMFDVISKYDWFSRYQVNFNFEKTEHNLYNYLNLISKFPAKKFIIQDNESNQKHIDSIIREIENDDFFPKNTNILYDSSSGRGTEIKSITQPYKDIYTGYSGGLNPENVESFCEKLIKFDNNSNIWIDMESGVRTDDLFDIDKVVKVLEIVKKSTL